MSLVFNKAIFTGSTLTDDAINTYLHTIFKLEKADKPPTLPPPAPALPPVFTDISDLATYRVDSGNLRVKIVLPSSLERGAFYRLTINPELADQSGSGSTAAPTAGLKIGQVTQPSGSATGGVPAIAIVFQVREVAEQLGAFNIRQDGTTAKGMVRDLALNGNTLLITALDGGLLAYDVADPAAITSTTLPVGRVDAGPNQFWASPRTSTAASSPPAWDPPSASSSRIASRISTSPARESPPIPARRTSSRAPRRSSRGRPDTAAATTRPSISR